MRAMNQASPAEPLPISVVGHAAPLARQLGAPEDVAALALIEANVMLCGARVTDAASLRRVLADYRERVLVPLEFPAICSAFAHASRGETRELIALDQRLAREAALMPFAEASRHAGRRQLGRLRPLRGQRIVQRYLAAVERGAARGWHTVAYGLTLALFSIPLRQGLAHYAQRTLRGFIESKAGPLRLGETVMEEVWEEVCAPIQPAVEHLFEFSPGGAEGNRFPANG